MMRVRFIDQSGASERADGGHKKLFLYKSVSEA